MDVNVAEDKPRDEHSPLPWTWDEPYEGGFPYDAKGHMAMYYTTDDDGIHFRTAGDKSYLLKAVNLHRELVDAVEFLQSLYGADWISDLLKRAKE